MKPYKTGDRTKGIIGLVIMTAAALILVFYSDRLYEWLNEMGKKNIVYGDGTYEGEGQGYGGTIKAEVTIAGNQITEVSLDGPEETPELGGRAIKKLPKAIMENQGADVDGVSGATLTSNGVREAVQNALDKARE